MSAAGCCGECNRCTCACTSIGILWAIDILSACLGVGLISAAVVIGDIPEVAVSVPNAVTTFAIVLGVIVLLSAAVPSFLVTLLASFFFFSFWSNLESHAMFRWA